MTSELIQDIIKWDVKSWSSALYFWEKNVDWLNVEKGLEIGGRAGGLSLWLALKDIHVVCSDLESVQDAASELHQKYKVTECIKYQDIDATKIPYENYFDVIVFKSVIGGIGRNDNFEMQKKTFQEIYKALKPGGKLLFAENLIASPFHQFFRKRFLNWGDSWRYMSLDEMKECLAIFSSYSINTTGFLATFGRNEKQRNVLATFDEAVFNRMSVRDWRYIGYGIAVK